MNVISVQSTTASRVRVTSSGARQMGHKNAGRSAHSNGRGGSSFCFLSRFLNHVISLFRILPGILPPPTPSQRARIVYSGGRQRGREERARASASALRPLPQRETSERLFVIVVVPHFFFFSFEHGQRPPQRSDGWARQVQAFEGGSPVVQQERRQVQQEAWRLSGA